MSLVKGMDGKTSKAQMHHIRSPKNSKSGLNQLQLQQDLQQQQQQQSSSPNQSYNNKYLNINNYEHPQISEFQNNDINLKEQNSQQHQIKHDDSYQQLQKVYDMKSLPKLQSQQFEQNSKQMNQNKQYIQNQKYNQTQKQNQNNQNYQNNQNNQSNQNNLNNQKVSKQTNYNIQYITNSNLNFIDNSKIQLFIENDSTSSVQVQDFLQNTPIDSIIQHQNQINPEKTDILNRTLQNNQVLVFDQNHNDESNQLLNDESLLNGNQSQMNGVNSPLLPPLQDKSQIINSNSQSKRYLPLLPTQSNSQIIYINQIKKKNNPQSSMKQVPQKQGQSQSQCSQYPKKGVQNDSAVLDKQQLLQKTITQKMLNMTQLFESVASQKQNKLKLTDSQNNIPFKLQGDDHHTLLPLSTTSKRSSNLKDLQRVNQLRSDFLILNRTKDVNVIEDEPYIKRLFEQRNKRSLSTNTGYNDKKKIAHLKDKVIQNEYCQRINLFFMQKRKHILTVSVDHSFSKNRQKISNIKMTQIMRVNQQKIQKITKKERSSINPQNQTPSQNQNRNNSQNQKIKLERHNINTSKDLTRFSFANNQQFKQQDDQPQNNIIYDQVSPQQKKKQTRDSSAPPNIGSHQSSHVFISSVPYFGEPQQAQTFYSNNKQ